MYSTTLRLLLESRTTKLRHPRPLFRRRQVRRHRLGDFVGVSWPRLAVDRQAAIAEADQLTKDAKALRDRVKDAKPSSAEASKLLSQASKVRSFVDSHQVPASSAAWKAAAGQVQVIATAYGTPWPH